MGAADGLAPLWQGEVKSLLVKAKGKGPRVLRHVFCEVYSLRAGLGRAPPEPLPPSHRSRCFSCSAAVGQWRRSAEYDYERHEPSNVRCPATLAFGEPNNTARAMQNSSRELRPIVGILLQGAES